MTDFNASSDPLHTADAASALAGLREPAEQAASAIDQAFGRAAESLTRSLARAAGDGKLSFAELARAAIAAADALAGGGSSGARGAGGGLGEALASLVTAAFQGARAEGGPVTGGGAYLVGERGPELFRPSTSGEITPGASGGVTVHLTVQGAGDPAAFVRSEAQLAQALARAAALGMR